MSENRQPASKIGKLVRLCAAVASMTILLFEYVGYKAALAINGYYFKDYSAPIGAMNFFWIALAAYLLLVAAFGRWFPRKGS